MAFPRVFLPVAVLATLFAMAGCNPPPDAGSGTGSAPPPPVTAQPVIALFTDFGTTDPYVAQMKGAILTIDPAARLLDLTHDVTPFDVAQGSYLLDQSAREFPAGTIFVAVVDSQVGSDRAPLLLKTGAGKFYLGPDNGLFSRVIDREGFAAAWTLDQRAYFRAGATSEAFPGRDIFGPVASHLAQGTDPGQMGTLVAEKSLEMSSMHAPEIAGGTVSVEVLHVDHYGNVILNLPVGGDAAAKFHLGNLVKISIGRESFTGPMVRTNAEGEKGRLILLYGANGLLEISMSQGSAAEKLKINPGTVILLKP
jgi:S-adenosyl-L-methionine hydrolase (adenosine-forming)